MRFQMTNISESFVLLPNTILLLLTIIIHLIQYLASLKAYLHVPHPGDSEAISASTTSSTETFGLCTGVLSVFVVGYASTLAELQEYWCP